MGTFGRWMEIRECIADTQGDSDKILGQSRPANRETVTFAGVTL